MLVNMGIEKRHPGLGKSFVRWAVKQLFRGLPDSAGCTAHGFRHSWVCKAIKEGGRAGSYSVHQLPKAGFRYKWVCAVREARGFADIDGWAR